MQPGGQATQKTGTHLPSVVVITKAMVKAMAKAMAGERQSFGIFFGPSRVMIHARNGGAREKEPAETSPAVTKKCVFLVGLKAPMLSYNCSLRFIYSLSLFGVCFGLAYRCEWAIGTFLGDLPAAFFFADPLPRARRLLGRSAF